MPSVQDLGCSPGLRSEGAAVEVVPRPSDQPGDVGESLAGWPGRSTTGREALSTPQASPSRSWSNRSCLGTGMLCLSKLYILIINLSKELYWCVFMKKKKPNKESFLIIMSPTPTAEMGWENLIQGRTKLSSRINSLNLADTELQS